MMAKKCVFDSNILINFFNHQYDMVEFGRHFGPYKWYISEMTELEVYAKPNLSPLEEAEIKAFLKKCRIVRLTRKIKKEAIIFRRTIRRKLPDSIIAATAAVLGITLISNDPHMAKTVYPGLRVEQFG
jgi:predicted nucleic acid-binding protein